jgi:predicted dehydrogenase
MASINRIVKVGIIGCGEITQVAHIPNLGFLSELFTITYLCDVSAESLKHNAQKVINHVPKTTQDPAQLCASPDVELVFIASSDEYHAAHVIEGLKYDKHVFIEKPMALCLRDADVIIEAEQKSKGKVFVGYMRRYAAAFLDTVKVIGGMDKILYARVRGKLPGLQYCKR